MNSLFKSLKVVVATVLVACSLQAGEFPDISVVDLKKAIGEKKATVIDVNGTDSWKEARVPGALDFDTVEKSLATKLPKDKNTLVVAYCGGPGCSAYLAAAEAAKKLGYTNVKHLSAGISGWQAAGEKTESGAAKEEKKEAEKKTSATTNGSHTYVATFSGITCSACKQHVREAIAKIPSTGEATFAPGTKTGTQLVTFTAKEAVQKEKLISALGDTASTYVVRDLAQQ